LLRIGPLDNGNAIDGREPFTVESLTAAVSWVTGVASAANNPQEVDMDKKAVELEYREKLSRLNGEIRSLKTEAANAGDKLRRRAEQRIADLERQQEAAGRKLDELRDAGHHAVSELKVGVEMAFKDLQRGLDAAREAATRRTGEG
jgi:chromosome segregation ATPase